MVITLEPGAPESTTEIIRRIVGRYRGVQAKSHKFQGAGHELVEIHLIGSTEQVPIEPFEAIPGVRRVLRVSHKYRLIGRHAQTDPVGFEYNGLQFDESTVHVFAGLCAVDTREHVDQMMAAVAQHGVYTTRMGAYKPRTSPYEFQGLGADCLPWVFDSAGKHGIKCIAMEIVHAGQIEEIDTALERAGRPTGVLLQIGTRNAQNFELLKHVGRQQTYPVLFKRGMGITLEESLNACEYIASEGNARIVFGLRGVKSNLGDPHRNFVDFAHVPVVRRQTRLPVCIDPSHSVGRMYIAPDGLPDIFHVVGQGLIAGASMILVDFHPHPDRALCDGPQALTLEQLPGFLHYVTRVRKAYEDLRAN